MLERKNEEFTCEECGKVTKATNRWSCWIRCECGAQAFGETRGQSANNILGYNAAGYNEGLGVHIEDHAHYKRVLKEKGLREAV